jgi:hypothetical protein
MPHAINAFTDDEAGVVQKMLEDLVRALRVVPGGGGKIEEDYWSYIYNTVRNAPTGGWSNLTMRDYCHAGLGVEMKLLKRRSPLKDQGRTLMHPSATRALKFNPSAGAEACKNAVLEQFGGLMREFRGRVGATCTDADADIRWGVLLWGESLEDFLYFEEPMIEPNPDNFYAEFVAGTHRGAARENLYIFERETGVKRYSVTMPDKGAKLQPYFDIPRVGDGAYAFRVPDDGRRPLWLKQETLDALHSALEHGNIDELIMTLLRERQARGIEE